MTVARFAERYALIGLMIAMIIIFAVLPATSSTFTSPVNIRGLIANQAVIAVLAFGTLFPLIAGEFDISIGPVLGGSAYFAGWLMERGGWPVPAALLAAIAAAALIGVVNGYLVAYVGASSLIITLGMSTFVGGLIILLSEGQIVSQLPRAFVDFGSLNIVGVPFITLAMIVAALLMGYVLRYSVYGRKLLYVGSNLKTARLVGLRVNRLKFSTFVLSSSVAAVAGMLLLMRSGSANPTTGAGYTLSALAVAFLGATTVVPGRFNVIGTLVAVLFVAIAVNGLTLAGAATWVEPVFNGLAVMVAVVLAILFRRQAERSR